MQWKRNREISSVLLSCQLSYLGLCVSVRLVRFKTKLEFSRATSIKVPNIKVTKICPVLAGVIQVDERIDITQQKGPLRDQAKAHKNKQP
jgi:hypothetical protein